RTRSCCIVHGRPNRRRSSSATRTKRGDSRVCPDRRSRLPFCIETPDGVVLAVRVIPRARKHEIAGTRDGALLVRLAAPPVEGAANDALIEFLAKRLGAPRRAVRIVSGERGRQKRLAVAGVNGNQVQRLVS